MATRVNAQSQYAASCVELWMCSAAAMPASLVQLVDHHDNNFGYYFRLITIIIKSKHTRVSVFRQSFLSLSVISMSFCRRNRRCQCCVPSIHGNLVEFRACKSTIERCWLTMLTMRFVVCVRVCVCVFGTMSMPRDAPSQCLYSIYEWMIFAVFVKRSCPAESWYFVWMVFAQQLICAIETKWENVGCVCGRQVAVAGSNDTANTQHCIPIWWFLFRRHKQPRSLIWLMLMAMMVLSRYFVQSFRFDDAFMRKGK